jgi:phenylalanyl-tRNA synthetase alpha chain
MKSLDLTQIAARIEGVSDEVALEQVRVELLGRSGTVTQLLREIGSLPADERKVAGGEANRLRGQVQELINAARTRVQAAAISQESSKITLDVTAPVEGAANQQPAFGRWGHVHPVNAVIDDLVQVFWQMGYAVVDGPEVETPWYNFEALNIPEDHPARDMQDTFYLEGGNLPRTHTSNMQIRHMEENQPPIRIISIGKVYRNEDEDARHVWMFNQIEGLVVDSDITLADLKGTLLAMMQGVLGEGTKLRLRPNYFPYVEPGVEMDASCPICEGSGRVIAHDGPQVECKTCSGTGWLEIGGAGMVHPQVLRNVNIDPERFSGFAFGFGAERIAMIKHDVSDLREFWRPNLKYLEQF